MHWLGLGQVDQPLPAELLPRGKQLVAGLAQEHVRAERDIRAQLDLRPAHVSQLLVLEVLPTRRAMGHAHVLQRAGPEVSCKISSNRPSAYHDSIERGLRRQSFGVEPWNDLQDVDGARMRSQAELHPDFRVRT